MCLVCLRVFVYLRTLLSVLDFCFDYSKFHDNDESAHFLFKLYAKSGVSHQRTLYLYANVWDFCLINSFTAGIIREKLRVVWK